ncbi:16S rRNA (guanine(527)-N(7))-methyltransferase RsmG [Oscillibacter sp.]|uniref:16S rRNA (guanine(527)-N(7))-methyltransferase RsmG n=1 Tax=Oscillibacter sp. TaxID=1945593 RepID=UPI002896DED8|nr:16S rRNA (guanine(527)-N(7))-methyltransferase RsmG [Oscillibacter sp.]
MMETILREGLTALGLEQSSIPSLLRYGALLEEKNKVMNLTAIKEADEVARLHFLDSAALLNLLDFRNKTVVDVGTGAGFPGLPIRLLEPSAHVTLLDSLGKRITFLQNVCTDLGLSDVECVHARAEEFAEKRRESFDTAVSRAVASLSVLSELCLPLVKTGGTFLAMKSVDSGDELSAAEHAISVLGGRLAGVRDYSIPGTDIVHRAVLVEKIKPTPKGYPRSFAKIKKDPL